MGLNLNVMAVRMKFEEKRGPRITQKFPQSNFDTFFLAQAFFWLLQRNSQSKMKRCTQICTGFSVLCTLLNNTYSVQVVFVCQTPNMILIV